MEFSNDEIKDMRAFYERELSSTLDRLRHIERILDKIGGAKVNVDVKMDGVATTASPKKKTTTTRRRGKKRGPKSIWGNFVLKKLKELDRPMTYDELVAAAMEFSNVPKEKEKNIRQSIINVTFKLRTKDEEIDTFSKGSRVKHIALKSWFDENGEIKEEYSKKAKVVKPKTRKRKSPRKRTASKSSTPKPSPKKVAESAASAPTSTPPAKPAATKSAAKPKAKAAPKTKAKASTAQHKKAPARSTKAAPSKANNAK